MAEDDGDSFLSGHSSESDSGELFDGDVDLLRYGQHGVSALWAAATHGGGGAAISQELLATRHAGLATDELSRRLRAPTHQCPYSRGHVPPEAQRIWALEAAESAAKGRAARRGVADPHGGGAASGASLKHRLRTTVWVMGDVSGALRALHVSHGGHSLLADRPLAPFSYQHAIVRSGATSGYSLLLHPDTMQRLRGAAGAKAAAPFASPAPQRAARGSGVGGGGGPGCSTPTAASALRGLRPVAASARWSQALLLSVEGDVYQWRVSGGRLLNEDEDDGGGGARGSRGGSFTLSTPGAGGTDGDSAAQPPPLALPTAATPQQPPRSAAPHPRFFSVSDRVVVTESGGAATEAAAPSLGPQLVTSFCILRALSGVRVAAVACGSAHCAALTFAPHCDVWTWGSGAAGRLGHGSEADELSPRLLEELIPYRVTAIAAGATHTAALTSGSLALLAQVRAAWLRAPERGGVHSPLPPLLQEQRLCAAAKHRRAREAATRSSSGNGASGDWADGLSVATGGARDDADAMRAGATTSPRGGGGGGGATPGLRGSAAAAAGGRPTGVRSSDDSAGAVWTWGSGRHGQLGHGDLRDRLKPARVRRIVRVTHRVLGASAWVDVSGGERRGRLRARWRIAQQRVPPLQTTTTRPAPTSASLLRTLSLPPPLRRPAWRAETMAGTRARGGASRRAPSLG